MAPVPQEATQLKKINAATTTTKTRFLSVITLRLIRTKKTHTSAEIESLTEVEDHSQSGLSG